MSPIRLIIIGILLYIGYKLITGGSGKKTKDENTRVKDEPSDVADILVEDPICKKLVPKKQAVHLEHEGEHIYFCGEECRKTFITEKGAQK